MILIIAVVGCCMCIIIGIGICFWMHRNINHRSKEQIFHGVAGKNSTLHSKDKNQSTEGGKNVSEVQLPVADGFNGIPPPPLLPVSLYDEVENQLSSKHLNCAKIENNMDSNLQETWEMDVTSYMQMDGEINDISIPMTGMCAVLYARNSSILEAFKVEEEKEDGQNIDYDDVIKFEASEKLKYLLNLFLFFIFCDCAGASTKIVLVPVVLDLTVYFSF